MGLAPWIPALYVRWLLHDTAGEEEAFARAKEHATTGDNKTFTGPFYLALSGTKKDEGLLLAYDCDGIAEQHELGGNVTFLANTNFDQADEHADEPETDGCYEKIQNAL